MLDRILVISYYPYKVLYMSNNNVKDWGEFQKLAELHQLEDLLFVGKQSNCNVYHHSKLSKEYICHASLSFCWKRVLIPSYIVLYQDFNKTLASRE